METLLSHLLTIAKNHPTRIALRCGAEAVPYKEFRVRIFDGGSARSRALGVGEGEPVLLCAEHACDSCAVLCGARIGRGSCVYWR